MSLTKGNVISEADGTKRDAVYADGNGLLHAPAVVVDENGAQVSAASPLPTSAQSSVVHAATPYPAAPIVANGGAADADGSDTAFGVACTMVTVDSDEDVYLANSELEAEAAADGTAWGRIFHRGGTAKEYPWGDSGGAATRAFWAQKISTDATVNVVGWAE